MNTPTKVLGVYKITYPSYNNTTQVKNLISHEDYTMSYKMWNSKKQELETELADLNKKKHPERAVELKNEIGAIKSKLHEMFGDEFFTDQSPLWLSQKVGGNMFLSAWQGGVIEVKLEKIE
jgi:uncharacterized protein YfcZ (UPF0381/DUF406 family)